MATNERQLDLASTPYDQLNPMRKIDKSMEPLKNPVSKRIEDTITVSQKSNVELTSKHKNTQKTSTQLGQDPEPIASVTIAKFPDIPIPSQDGSGPVHITATSIHYNTAQAAADPTHVDEEGYVILNPVSPKYVAVNEGMDQDYCSKKNCLICLMIVAGAAITFGVILGAVLMLGATNNSDLIWGEWGECTRTCGEGIRMRGCSDPDSTDERCNKFHPEEMIKPCNARPCPQPDPEWNKWSAWSVCDATCDGGVQKRNRTCNDSVQDDSNLCVGEKTDTRECNIWKCPCCWPACTTPCEQGNRNNDCVCECDTHVLNGTVVDGTKKPLDGAFVYRAERPDIKLATSGSDGKFNVPGVCSQSQGMIVKRPMFTTFTGNTKQTSSSLSSIHAVIEKMELPFISDHPVSKVRIEGDSVVFCCTATSKPPPTKYEWFKNDKIMRLDGHILEMTNLKTDDSGLYRCRVHNDAGRIFSYPAELSVTESAMDCDPPQSKILQLPTDCIQPDTNRNQYDVGTCGKRECHGKKTDQMSCEDNEDEMFCCQPTETYPVTIQCKGYNLTVSKVLSCGCGKCLPQRSSKIRGRVENSKTGEPLRFIDIYFNDSKVNTIYDGMFVFETTNNVRRVSLLFRDDQTPKRVMDTVVVVEVARDSEVFRTIKMKPRSSPFIFSSSENKGITLAHNEDSTHVAELMVAPNTVMDANGQPYSGMIKAFVNNIDMRDMSDAQIAPGDFTAIDDEGLEDELQSFGMFSVDLENPDDGSPLVAGGSSVVMVNQNMLPECILDAYGFCDTKLWVLNIKTGLWELESELHPSSDTRNKRQATSMLVGSITYSCNQQGRRPCIYNIDRFTRSERCWAHVVGFDSEEFMNVLPKIIVTSIVNDSNTPFLIINNNAAWATRSAYNGVCVPQGCDDSTTDIAVESRQFTTHLVVQQQLQTYLLPFDPKDSNLNQTKFALNSGVVTALNYTIDKGQANTAIVFKPTIRHASGKGPIHPGKNAGKGGSCSTATVTSSAYFQFYQGQRLLCTTYQPVPDKDDPRYNTIYTFYPIGTGVDSRTNYCFVGAQVSRVTKGLRVVSISEFLNDEPSSASLPMANKIFFGRREIIPEQTSDGNYNVCMEYKCGGQIITGSNLESIGNAYTKVTIDIRDANSSLSCSVSINPDLMIDVMTAGLEMCDGDPFESGTTYQTPLCFIDPQRYGDTQGVFRINNPSDGMVCPGDEYSPQSLRTSSCNGGDKSFLPLFDITC